MSAQKFVGIHGLDLGRCSMSWEYMALRPETVLYRLTEIGLAGWELAGSIPEWTIFKRPLSEDGLMRLVNMEATA